MNLYSLYVLSVISLGYLATDIYLPSLPAIAKNFGTSDTHVQLTIFAYLASLSVAPLYFGPVSDSIGRKKIIVFGLLISLISSFFAIFQSSIVGLMFCRFLQGAGLGAALTAARTIISDLFRGKEFVKQISYIAMLMPLVLALAPVIGGALQENYGWRSIFVFLVIYITIILAIATRSSETLQTAHKFKFLDTLKNYIKIMQNIPFMLFSFCIVIPTVLIFAYLTASSFLFQKLIGLSPLEFGITSVYVGAIIMSFSFINAKLSNYFEPIYVLMVSALFITLSGILILFFSYNNAAISKWQLLGPVLLFFTCIPLGLANASSLAIAQIKTRFGAANAFLASLQFLSGAAASFVFSFIPETSALPLAAAFLIGGFILIITAIVANQKLKKGI